MITRLLRPAQLGPRHVHLPSSPRVKRRVFQCTVDEFDIVGLAGPVDACLRTCLAKQSAARSFSSNSTGQCAVGAPRDLMLGRTQQIPAKRPARLEWNAKADLKAVWVLSVPISRFDLWRLRLPIRRAQRHSGRLRHRFLPQREASSFGNVMIKDSACSIGSSSLTAAPEASRNSSPTSPPSGATRQFVSFSLQFSALQEPFPIAFAILRDTYLNIAYTGFLD